MNIFSTPVRILYFLILTLWAQSQKLVATDCCSSFVNCKRNSPWIKLSSKYFIVTKQRSLKWYIIGDGMTFMVMPAKSLMATNYLNLKKSSLCYCHLSIKMSKMSTRSTTELTQSFLDFENLSQKHPTLQLIRVKIHFRPIFSYRKEFGSNLPGEKIVNRRSQNPWLPLVQAIEQQGQITCIPILWRTMLRPLCLQTKPR